MSASSLSHLLLSNGLFVRKVARSVWVHGANPAQFHAARPFIQQVMNERPHTRLVATSAAPATVEYLARTLPDEQALPLPWARGGAIRRFLRSVRPGVVLLLDSGRTFGRTAATCTLRAGVPTALLVSEPADRIAPHIIESARQHPGRVVFCLSTPRDVERLIALGVPAASVHHVGELAADPAHPAAQTTAHAVRRLLAVETSVPLVMAADVPEHEESLILAAFGEARLARSDLRLVLAPRHRNRGARLAEQVAAAGWTCRRRTNPLASESPDAWDVLLAEVPGEEPALLSATSAMLIGGSWSGTADTALDTLARAAGCAALGADTPAGRLGSALSQILTREHDTRPANRSSAKENCLAALADLLPQSPRLPPVAQAWRLPTLRDRAGASRGWRAVAPMVRGTRYDEVAALRERLNRPRSVLCLGNGPSSEDPLLGGIEHDSLFRVNWRWKDRGLLTSPDVVFVGDACTVQKLSGCIFGVWTIELEYGMLLRNLVTHGLRRMECVTLERISPLVRDRAWPGRPTNGALMIVLAAALQPERLVISGMDLFQHPDGRYPGDLSSPNQYSRVHERETDVAMIALALRQYRGEVVILSDILRESLERYA